MNKPENNLENIDLTGLDKAAVLATLYNGAKPQGAGFLQYDSKPMSVEEAQELLKRAQSFDYLKGRVMKVDLSGDKLVARLYDRDNGENVALALINSLRENEDPNNPTIHDHHVSETKRSEQITRELLYEDQTEFRDDGGMPTLHLGYSGLAHALETKLRKVRELLRNDDNKENS